MATYDKPVRDKIPEFLDSKNIPYESRVLGDEEYKDELIIKLEEELNEFKTDLSVEELADIVEVLDALKKLPEYQNVEQVRMQKLEEKGGFEKRLKLKGEK